MESETDNEVHNNLNNELERTIVPVVSTALSESVLQEIPDLVSS